MIFPILSTKVWWRSNYERFFWGSYQKKILDKYDWILLCIILGYCCYYSTILPVNFDEAYNLQVPIKLVTELRYDTIYHTRKFDAITTITTGPTVLLPVALVFKIFGIGIIQARSVSIVYFNALLVFFYVLSILFFQTKGYGLILILLILSISQIEIAFYVLGEIAALFFLIIGLAIWIWNIDNGYKYLAFIIMGLSVITKLYFILSVIPLLITLTLSKSENRFSQKQKIGEIMLCGLCFIIPFLIYETIKLIYLGFGGYLKYFNVLGEFTRSQIVEGFITQSDLFTHLLGGKLITVAKGIFPKMPIPITGLLFIGITFNFLKYLRQEVTKHRNLFIALYLIFVTYCFWFVFVDAMGWWRRMLPFGIVALYLVCDFFRIWLNHLKSPSLRVSLKLIIFVMFVIYIISNFSEHFEKFPNYREGLKAQYEFANRVNYYLVEGYQIRVYGWWQAPEISFLLRGVKFRYFRCSKKYSKDFLVIYTKLHENILPQDAERLRQCLGDLIEVSNDRQYFLYAPKNSRP